MGLVAFNAALHPRAPAGSPAGGKFAAGGGGQAAAKPGAKPAAKPGAKKPVKVTPAMLAAAKKKQAAKNADLKKWTTMANKGQGKKLTPAERMAVSDAHKAHVAHEAHVAHAKTHPAKKTAKPKTVKAKTVKKATVKAAAKPKATVAKKPPTSKATVSALPGGSR